jgi:speckle-type POZ protein
VFYPDGSEDDCAGYASAFLRCVGPTCADAVRTEFTLDIVENRGQGQAGASKTHATMRHTFAPATQSGIPKFIEKSRLRSLCSRLSAGHFKVRCVLAVIKEPLTESNRNLSAIPQPELFGDLERAVREGQGADVTFGVGGREFSAHRFMLAARSPVFKAELFDPTTEEDMRHVEVVDMEPSIFQMLLYFVYTD